MRCAVVVSISIAQFTVLELRISCFVPGFQYNGHKNLMAMLQKKDEERDNEERKREQKNNRKEKDNIVRPCCRS